MTKKLSPAAYAVWNAFLDRYEWEVTTEELFAVAAVLRAAAEECAGLPDGSNCTNLLTEIASELEAQ